MKTRPYLTYNGTCEEAINIYQRAFKTEVMDILRFSDIPSNPEFKIPDDYKNKILQATLKMGDDFIRMSDCGPGVELIDPESARLSIAVETNLRDVKYAFEILAKEGHVGIPLDKTFYSPLAGVVYDKFGVMWNFVGQA